MFRILKQAPSTGAFCMTGCIQCLQNIKCLTGSLQYSTSTIPTQSRVVIAGAGIVANSLAYHLAQNGWQDVLVLEQNKIGSGSSHFGSGTLGLFKPISQRNLILYSIKLYQDLQDQGYDIGMKQCGSLNLAQTKDRLIALRRRIAYNIPTGLYCELLTPKDISALHPYMNVDDLEGAVYVPDDAVADPSAICQVLAEIAQEKGVVYKEGVFVERVLTKNDRVSSVITDKGEVKCEYFVNCAGMWAREVGLACDEKVKIPAYPAEHYYATTEGQHSEEETLPCVRDFDSFAYCRDFGTGFLCGWFEPEAKAAFNESATIPRDWQNHIKHEWKYFDKNWKNMVKRFPLLATSRPELVNSPDNFTPDGRWILGEAPTVGNYFVACGMNGNSLQGAGGIGKAVAEWIIEGRPTQDLLPFNIQRFLDIHGGRHYLQQRIKEIVGRNYSILYPHQCEYKYARKLRCSPLYSVLQTRGAVFGIKMAYERALYFDSTAALDDHTKLPEMPPGSFYKPAFFDFMQEEYLACREGVGIIDMSSFSKIEIKSDNLQEIITYLQRLCTNDIDIPVGAIVHTGMLNAQGGYENDCMLVRQSDVKFFMVSPTSQQTRIYEWMKRNRPADAQIVLNDITSMYTVINVVGPKASELLGELSNNDMQLAPFSYKKVNVGYASDVMLMSFTHTGEPGYCLYIPSEYALHVYYRLMKVGKDYGIRDVGTLTQRFMRIERFIPFWAEELTSFVTPYEAGNSYIIKLDKKEEFVGKRVLQRQKSQGVQKQLVFFQLEEIDPDVDIWPWGGEPIYRNGYFVGTITSAGYGFSSNKLIGLGYIRRPIESEIKTVNAEYIMSKDAKYEVDIAGQRFPMRAYMHSPIAQSNARSRRKYRPTVRKESDITY
ncbi:pyruvate dehydrogenase phosphatase regulatory subunit, mitochondrial-like [Atheta coriaria]|uniref:pyruvate dehydrogenase phosphatase regulatory subunit, mitochondrial-like n=1 Tax=Dalotia coriaria TaxID=877792 RepID=UPI0031F43A3B